MIEKTRSLPETVETSRDRTNRLILALLLVRFLYGALTALLLPLASLVVSFFNVIYILLTYLITAQLIWHERHRLSKYQMSKLAVYLFILAVPYLLILNYLGAGRINTLQIIATWTMLPISLWLLLSLRRDPSQVLSNPSKLPTWIMVGVLAGIAGGFFSGFMLRLQHGGSGIEHAPVAWLILPTIQLSTAAIQEEPLFRGFLWGYLEDKGWHGKWIWLAQAGFFWLGHIYYLGRDPISFWLVVPLMGMLLGLVAWRAKDAAPSMFTHAITNGVGSIVAGT